MPTFDETFEQVAASLPDLRGSELVALLASATHVARNSVCITDAQLGDPGPRIIYVNPAFERMTGYTAAEVLGRPTSFIQSEEGLGGEGAGVDAVRRGAVNGEAS